ncbi:MAG: hypothetical protein H0T84_00985 [Tatlockia sp.]|nr:hypothetical protein [Tatlockia sp.]
MPFLNIAEHLESLSNLRHSSESLLKSKKFEAEKQGFSICINIIQVELNFYRATKHPAYLHQAEETLNELCTLVNETSLGFFGADDIIIEERQKIELLKEERLIQYFSHFMHEISHYAQKSTHPINMLPLEIIQKVASHLVGHCNMTGEQELQLITDNFHQPTPSIFYEERFHLLQKIAHMNDPWSEESPDIIHLMQLKGDFDKIYQQILDSLTELKKVDLELPEQFFQDTLEEKCKIAEKSFNKQKSYWNLDEKIKNLLKEYGNLKGIFTKEQIAITKQTVDKKIIQINEDISSSNLEPKKQQFLVGHLDKQKIVLKNYLSKLEDINNQSTKQVIDSLSTIIKKEAEEFVLSISNAKNDSELSQCENSFSSCRQKIQEQITKVDNSEWVEKLTNQLDASYSHCNEILGEKKILIATQHQLQDKNNFVPLIQSKPANNQIQNNYAFSVSKNSDGRYHFFEASAPKELVELEEYKGDHLKTKILNDFKSRIEGVQTKQGFNHIKKELLSETNEKTNVLRTAQGCWSSFWGTKTSSIEALEDMLNQRAIQPFL